MNEQVLISGASIAGPALAFWLARYGFRPTVVERAPRLREGGNGVDVREQAVQVAERMGILPRIRAAATDVIGTAFVDAANRSVARMDMRAIVGESARSAVELLRGDLAAILYEATRDDVEYVFGDSIRTLEQDAGGVTVAFERGATRRFDLVVGADGMPSAVRRLAFGPESRFVRHLGHYGAYADADPALGEARWVTLYNLPGKVAGVYRSGHHAGAKALFMFYRREPLTYDHRDVEQQKRLLSEAFAGVSSWRVPELLAGALADPDFYFDALGQGRMPAGSAGRVALVGDAAYCASPVSGAGATLSLIGAYRLAGELAAAPGDHAVAFRRYEEGYRGTVRRSQSGLFLGFVAPRSRIGIWARNAVARLPLLGAVGGIERFLRPRPTEPLPDYAGVGAGTNRSVGARSTGLAT